MCFLLFYMAKKKKGSADGKAEFKKYPWSGTTFFKKK